MKLLEKSGFSVITFAIVELEDPLIKVEEIKEEDDAVVILEEEEVFIAIEEEEIAPVTLECKEELPGSSDEESEKRQTVIQPDKNENSNIARPYMYKPKPKKIIPVEDLTCPICKKKQETRTKVRMHIAAVHEHIKRFACGKLHIFITESC